MLVFECITHMYFTGGTQIFRSLPETSYISQKNSYEQKRLFSIS